MEEKNERKEVEEKALLKWWVYIKHSSKDLMCFILFNIPKSCEVGITPFLQTAIQWQDCNSKSDLYPSMTHTLSTPLSYLDNQMSFLLILGTTYLVRFQYTEFLNLQKS